MQISKRGLDRQTDRQTDLSYLFIPAEFDFCCLVGENILRDNSRGRRMTRQKLDHFIVVNVGSMKLKVFRGISDFNFDESWLPGTVPPRTSWMPRIENTRTVWPQNPPFSSRSHSTLNPRPKITTNCSTAWTMNSIPQV